MKKWIDAARLRTLPLSLSGIILGSLIAFGENQIDWIIFILACTTTLFLQILSNYANDYGDGIKGTDDARTGEKRAVASGEISPKNMKNAIILMAVLSIISATALLAYAFLPHFWVWFVVFMLLGIASIWAAIGYTVGDKAYGYKALGDLFVFLFFGIVAVFGTYVLYTKTINYWIFLPAAANGLLSVAVLNLNNMRDLRQDKKVGKKTIPIILGFLYAKNYHGFLLLFPFVLGTLYFTQQDLFYWQHYIFLLCLIPAIFLLVRVANTHEYKKLDSELKRTAFFTLAFAIIFGFCTFLPTCFGSL